MAKVAVKGLDKLVRQFEQFGEDAKHMANIELEDGAKEIEELAVKLAPANIGKLRQGIKFVRINDLRYEVIARAPYSGYVEFGTGTKVDVPTELKDVAQAIRNNPVDGEKTGLEAIQDYCRQKGIPEEAAFLIFMKILKVGIRPQPFMYPAWKQGSINTEKRLEKSLDKEVKKFNAKK